MHTRASQTSLAYLIPSLISASKFRQSNTANKVAFRDIAKGSSQINRLLAIINLNFKFSESKESMQSNLNLQQDAINTFVQKALEKPQDVELDYSSLDVRDLGFHEDLLRDAFKRAGVVVSTQGHMLGLVYGKCKAVRCTETSHNANLNEILAETIVNQLGGITGLHANLSKVPELMNFLPDSGRQAGQLLVGAINQYTKGKFIRAFTDKFIKAEGGLVAFYEGAHNQANRAFKKKCVYPKKLGNWPGKPQSTKKAVKGSKMIKLGKRGNFGAVALDTEENCHKAIQRALSDQSQPANFTWKIDSFAKNEQGLY